MVFLRVGHLKQDVQNRFGVISRTDSDNLIKYRMLIPRPGSLEPNSVCLEALPTGLGGVLTPPDEMSDCSGNVSSSFFLLQLLIKDGEFINLFMSVTPSVDGEFLEE